MIMTYLLYYTLTGIAYLISISVIWSLSFILLSPKLKTLKSLLLVSWVLVIIVACLVGYLFEHLFFDNLVVIRLSSYTFLHLIIFVVLLKSTLFKTLPGPSIKQIEPEDTKYWTLDTGSKIAYWHYKATGKKKPNPIVYIHGGPGAHVRNIDRAFFKTFTNDGYDVLLYDQAGGGFSDYININDYSMDRFIDDLESIRININAGKMILVGQSFGARICSHYAATYADNVESIIYAGAAGLKEKSIKQDTEENKKLKQSKIEFASSDKDSFKPHFKELIRFAFSIIMCKIGGERIVNQFLSQKEITEYSTRMIPDAISRAYHKKYQDQVPNITSGGINLIVNVLMHNNYDKISVGLINELSSSDIPVLILRSAYDYVPWEDTKYYREVFINHYMIYIPESGHIAWSINKEDTFNSIRDFVNGNTKNLNCYTGDTNPLYER